jgi:hypothetical protein
MPDSAASNRRCPGREVPKVKWPAADKTVYGSGKFPERGTRITRGANVARLVPSVHLQPEGRRLPEPAPPVIDPGD